MYSVVCFLARAGIEFFTVYESFAHWSDSFSAPTWLTIFYFLVLEVAPISLMLFLLRKLPKYVCLFICLLVVFVSYRRDMVQSCP